MMSSFKVAAISPIFALLTAVAAFGGWIAYDASRPVAQRHTRQSEQGEPAPAPEVVLAGTHVGMPRSIAERHLASFALPVSAPINASAEAPPQSSYRVHLRHPIPHLMQADGLHAFQPGPHQLTLQFDGQRPGQPISHIELTPLARQ